MSNQYNPLPGTTFNGMNDTAPTAIQAPTSPNSFANPLHFTFAGAGPDNVPTWANGIKLLNLFGDSVVDYNGKFATHQTPFLYYTNKKATPLCVIRLLPPDVGDKPRLVIWAEVLNSTKVKKYKRNDLGGHALDADGNKIAEGVTPGMKVRFFVTNVTGDISGLSSRAGNYNEDGEGSICYPLFAFEHSWYGADGANLGLRIWPLTQDDLPDFTKDDLVAQGFPFRAQLVKRSKTSITGVIKNTILGSKYTEGSFMANAKDQTTNESYELLRAMISSYSNETADTPVYSEIGQIHRYDAYVDKLQQTLASYLGVDDFQTVNPFTGTDFSGNPYDGWELLDDVADSDTFIFSKSVSTFFKGGSDGTISDKTFDDALSNYLDGIVGWDEHVLTDMGLSPIKSLVDSGFSMDAKYKLIKFACGIHRALVPFMSTQDMSKSANTPERDISALKLLTTYAASFPESTVFSTEVVRGMILPNLITVSSLNYSRSVPMIYKAWTAFIDAFGRADGKIDDQLMMNRLSQRTFNDVTSMTYTYQGATARKAVWDAGGVVTQGHDPRTYFVPAWRSIHASGTSILSDIENVVCAVDFMHQAWKTWRDLTSFKGTQSELIQQANSVLASYTAPEKYAGLVDITPNCYLDSYDVTNGFSWHIDGVMEGSPGARNATISLSSQRRSNKE